MFFNAQDEGFALHFTSPGGYCVGELLAGSGHECSLRWCQNVWCGERRPQGFLRVLHRSKNCLHQTLKMTLKLLGGYSYKTMLITVYTLYSVAWCHDVAQVTIGALCCNIYLFESYENISSYPGGGKWSGSGLQKLMYDTV